MKPRSQSRSLLALILCVSFSRANAQPFYAFEYESNEKRATHQTSASVATTLGYQTVDGDEYSLKVGISQPSLGHGQLSEGLEAQAKMPFLANDRYTPYAVFGLGEKIKPTEHFAFYYAGTGVKLPVTGASSADIGIVSSNAFDPDRRIRTTRLHAALSFSLSHSDSINFRAARSFGVASEEKDSLRVMYARAF